MVNEHPEEVRILLDNQRSQLESLTAAAALARMMNVRLQGLYIEEENLLRAADLNLSREISLWSAQERHMTGESIERMLRANARHKQKELEQVARKEKVEYSFQIIRGGRVRWIQESVNTSGVLFIGGKDMAPRRYQHLKYCSYRKDLLQVVFSGSPASERALKTAVQIAELDKRPLLILTTVGESADELILREQINILLEKRLKTTISIETRSKEDVLSSLRKRQVHMLIIPSDIDWAQDEKQLEKLLQQVHCPVILVR